jgi:peptidoglycan/xylan/chitin deacetylase (PgdA/CDA1 family)
MDPFVTLSAAAAVTKRLKLGTGVCLVIQRGYNQKTADNLVAAQSWVRYDPLIAIPRLVEQFARLGLRQTFFVPGWVIEKYPAQIDLLLKKGHEIALHGHSTSARTRSTRTTNTIGSAARSTPTGSMSAPGRGAGGRRASLSRNTRCATCSMRASNTTPR